MKVAIDLGFGSTKVCTDKGVCFKFPTWLAYHSESAVSELETVTVDGKTYVVGEDARYERQKIVITSINELVAYFPVFKKYVLQKLGVDDVNIITGLPPVYKDKASLLESDGSKTVKVLPQGLGIYLDVVDKIGDEMIIIDIGFNTVDYLLVVKGKKKKGNTIEKMGVERMVELFRNRIPDNLSYIKQFSFQRLSDIFEKGYAVVEGEKIDLSDIKEKAIDEYNEVLITRLKDEIAHLMNEVEQLVIAGGGAYYIKGVKRAYIPEQPEFSQARGFLKWEE